jgi:hypothetical protein
MPWSPSSRTAGSARTGSTARIGLPKSPARLSRGGRFLLGGPKSFLRPSLRRPSLVDCIGSAVNQKDVGSNLICGATRFEVRTYARTVNSAFPSFSPKWPE